MPLSDADIVQTNQGSFNATSGSATLPVGTTAGNTVLVAVATAGAAQASMAGFTKDTPTPATTHKAYVFRKSNVAADETSWTISGFSVAQETAWVAYEVQGIDPDVPVDVVPAAYQQTASGTSQSTGTTPTSTTYDGMAVAVWVSSAAGTAPTWSGQTGGFTEAAEQTASDGTNSIDLAVGTKYLQALEAVTSTATASGTAALGATVVVYSAQGAKRAPDVALCFGAEIGTAAGLNTGNAGCAPVDAITGTPTITSSTPRSGAYCLELSASAAAENVQWTNTESLGLVPMNPATATLDYLTVRLSFRFVGSLPAGDVELLLVGANASGGTSCATVRFRQASSKLGVTVHGISAPGTEQLSDATVAADAWYDLDLRFFQRATTWTADWRINYGSGYVDQTQATKSGESAGPPSIVVVGWVTAATATVRFDDIVITKNPGHYPLGDFQVLPITVDPAGTLTVSGSTANFNTFSSNGTMAAWNATTARGAIDDVPPTIGASADGLAQVTAAATEYVEVPLTSVQGAPDGAIRGARLYFCGWAASGTAATIGFRDHDGSAEHTLLAATDPAFDNSTTDPAWVCRMAGRTSPGGAAPIWTQAKLDALVARVGFSDDATPDIGVHSVIGEVAKQLTSNEPVFGAAGAVPRVEARTDPLSGGIIALDTWTTATEALEVTYELSGTPTTYTAPAGSSPHTQTVDAPDFPTTNWVSARPA